MKKKSKFSDSMSRRIQRENNLTDYLIKNIYKRLLAGSEINLDLIFEPGDTWNTSLRFNVLGEFIFKNMESEMIIPPIQAVSRISQFVSDIKTQDMLEIVVSKLKWLSSLLDKN